MKLDLSVPGGRCAILVRSGALANAGRFVRSAAPSAARAAVVCDARTRRYADRVGDSVARAGLQAARLVVRAAEADKNPASLARLWSAFAEMGLDRHACVVVVGGGVLGDLAGFAAATYMRGIAAVQIPTTLLAQVDASIGGKTAVNLPQGKNLAGTFTQPRGVLIDPQALRTLPRRHYATGLAEVIKYGVVADAALFDRIEREPEPVLRRDPRALEAVVGTCVRVKARVVSKDERESGLRMILNYGHTVGHALERATGYRSTHGEAVAVGMAAEARIARARGLCSEGFVRRQDALIGRMGLPLRVRLAPPARSRFLKALKLDKKAKGGAVRFVLPLGPGRVRYPVPVSPDQVLAALEEIFL